MDNLVDKLVDKMVNRMLNVRHHDDVLDHATLAKDDLNNQLALPSGHLSGFPRADLSSAHQLRGGLGLGTALQLRGGDASLGEEFTDMKIKMEDTGKKGVDGRAEAMRRYTEICESHGKSAEPYLVDLLPQVLVAQSDKEKKVAKEAKAALDCVPKIMSPYAADVVMPMCIEHLDDIQHKWPTRVAATNLLAHFAENAPAQAQMHLVEAFPKLTTLMNDLREEQSVAARDAATKCCKSVGNRDVENLIPQLVSMMANHEETEVCVAALAGTVFVSEVKRGALAMIIPLLQEGFQVKKDATKRMCGKIVANMAKLVEEPAEAGPFLPFLMPCLKQTAESISDPEARTVLEGASATLQKIKDQGEAKPFKLADTTGIANTLLSHIPKADNVTATYCAKLCASAANLRCFGDDEWNSCIKPCMIDMASEQELTTATKAIKDKCEAELGGDDDAEDEQDDAEQLCNCEFTLAYGSKIVLRKTKMRLKRGFKYGLIGKSESGKTTLMRAIANAQVDGFPPPSEVRTVFVEADILGEKSHYTCVEYVMDDPGIIALNIGREAVAAKLLAVGFSDGTEVAVGAANINDPVSTLSGGWRMKLALSRAMLQDPDIILMDEPTNHLDVLNVKWVQDYLMGLKDVTAIFTSHDTKTLDKVCTHILHIHDFKLSLHKGALTEFVKTHPEAQSYFELKAQKMVMHFPDPGYLEGIKSKGRALMKMADCEWTYPSNTKPTIEHVTIQVSLQSRVAILGPNGAGKSTMIKLLTGENIPQKGTVWKYQGARVAYVAQHAFEHIENHLTKTPNEYIRWRFEIDGEDREAIKKATMTLTDEEDEIRQKGIVIKTKDADNKEITLKGVVEKLTGMRHLTPTKEFEYEVKWSFLGPERNTFIPLGKLKECGELYMKMVKVVDEKIASNPLNARALTAKNVEKQLEDVGLEKEYGSHTPISQLSGGQKVKVVFAAALWRRPHIVLLDEPTNYLDREALGALTQAVREFEGGIVIISHNEEFTSTLCTETWLMSKSEATGIATLTPTGADWMSQELDKAMGEKITKKNDEPDEITDALGNTIKVEKQLSPEQKKKRIKEIEKQLKLSTKKNSELTEEDVWKLEDEMDALKAGLPPSGA
jgi:elongation factor 3